MFQAGRTLSDSRPTFPHAQIDVRAPMVCVSSFLDDAGRTVSPAMVPGCCTARKRGHDCGESKHRALHRAQETRAQCDGARRYAGSEGWTDCRPGGARGRARRRDYCEPCDGFPRRAW